MASIPYIVSGTLTDSIGDKETNASILFTISDSERVITNLKGQYLIDLSNIDYSSGDTVTYLAKDEFENEIYSGSFVITGEEKTLNIALSAITDRVQGSGNRDITITNIGGKPVSSDNPFPVKEISLPENYASDWTISRSDGQPDSELITIGTKTYKRTFAYTSNILTKRSKWERQS